MCERAWSIRLLGIGACCIGLALAANAWGLNGSRLQGNVAYSIIGNNVVVSANQVQNTDTSGASNNLRLTLWALATPLTGGSFSGYRLAVYSLGTLNAGGQLSNVNSGAMPIALPPTGAWYLTLTLEEYANSSSDDGYVYDDFHDFADPVTFPGVSPGTSEAIEYYYAAADEYFISATPAEIAALDNNRFPGWVRTGFVFGAYSAIVGGANPVCRFYIPPASHFYSASAAECALTAQRFPTLIEELANVFYIALPDTTTGACPAGAIPVYRVFDNRTDPNHRYTTDPAIRAQMETQGWVPEGYGPDAVIMCAPSSIGNGTVALASTSVTIPGGGGSGSVAVIANGAWSAVSNASWITITSASSGFGNGIVTFFADANASVASSKLAEVCRSGSITIGGAVVPVNQCSPVNPPPPPPPNCKYSISPSGSSAAAGGGQGAFTVTAAAGCPWTAVSNASWLVVTSGSSGSGFGGVNFSIAQNPATAQRIGTITITGNNAFTITQAGAAAGLPVIQNCPQGVTFTQGGAVPAVQVTATGGTPPYSWMLDTFATGTPPFGVGLNPLNGSLTGTVSNTASLGPTSFGVCAVDSTGAKTKPCCTITGNVVLAENFVGQFSGMGFSNTPGVTGAPVGGSVAFAIAGGIAAEKKRGPVNGAASAIVVFSAPISGSGTLSPDNSFSVTGNGQFFAVPVPCTFRGSVAANPDGSASASGTFTCQGSSQGIDLEAAGTWTASKP